MRVFPLQLAFEAPFVGVREGLLGSQEPEVPFPRSTESKEVKIQEEEREFSSLSYLVNSSLN